MRQLALCAGVAALVCGLGALPAQAQTRQLYASGLWAAYGGTGDDQRAVCGVSTSGADGRRIAVQQSAGETDIEMLMDKPSWAIPDNTPIDLAVQFDNGTSNQDRATGTGTRVTLRLPFDRSIPFMRQLRGASQLRVYFPTGNEAPWTGGLAGSSAAIDAFNDCRAALAPAGPTQPFPSSQQAPAPGPSQPFSAPRP